jgi:hypothetical protein
MDGLLIEIPTCHQRKIEPGRMQRRATCHVDISIECRSERRDVSFWGGITKEITKKMTGAVKV